MITIGPYVAGEIPAPLEYQFQDDNGTPLTATGMTATFAFAPLGGGEATEADADYEESTATATYTWGDTDITAGLWVGEFTIDNGTNQFKSVRLLWLTKPALATVAS